MGGKIPLAYWAQIFWEEDIPDVITCFKFVDDRFRSLVSAEGQILPLPIDFDSRPYNTLTLPCGVSVWLPLIGVQEKINDLWLKKSINTLTV